MDPTCLVLITIAKSIDTISQHRNWQKLLVALAIITSRRWPRPTSPDSWGCRWIRAPMRQVTLHSKARKLALNYGCKSWHNLSGELALLIVGASAWHGYSRADLDPEIKTGSSSKRRKPIMKARLSSLTPAISATVTMQILIVVVATAAQNPQLQENWGRSNAPRPPTSRRWDSTLGRRRKP